MQPHHGTTLVAILALSLLVCSCAKTEDKEDPPDLYSGATATLTTTAVKSGDSVVASCTVINGGTGAAGAFSVTFYAQVNTTLGTAGDHPLGTVTVGGLAAGASTVVDLTNGDVTGVAHGIYYLGWVIDSGGALSESNEGNNNGYLASPRLQLGEYGQTTFALGMTSVSAGATMLFDGGVASYDDQSSTLSIPFTVTFYGNSYTSCLVSTNGYITFGSDGTDFSNDAIPNTNLPNDTVALFWDDLIVSNSSGGTTDQIFYRVDGTTPNRVLTIEYSSVSRLGQATETYLYGQIKIHEAVSGNNPIELCYDTLQDWTWTGGAISATIGVENSGGTEGVDAGGSPGISAPPSSNLRFE